MNSEIEIFLKEWKQFELYWFPYDFVLDELLLFTSNEMRDIFIFVAANWKESGRRKKKQMKEVK